MKPIGKCRVAGCGLVIGYTREDGTDICWLHARQQKLPAALEDARNLR